MKIWVPVFLTASLLSAGSGITRAQAPPASVPAARLAPLPSPTDYPGESYVFNHLYRIYTFAADGTGSREFEGTVEIRNQAGVKAFSVLPFEFASNSEHIEIDYVRVRHADGSVVTTPPADAQDLPAEVTRQAPFYSDIKQEQIPVRSLQPGDLLEYKLRIVRTKPEAPGHFWGNDSFFLPSSGAVIRSETIELHVPKDGYLQVWSPNYKPTLSDTPTERVYRWQSSQLAPTAGQKKNALLKLDNNPTLGTNDDPALPHIAWTNFHTWQEVGAWYRSLEGSRTEPGDDIRAKVATLTAGKSTPDEKARAIYAYVSSQVRYIGVAFGIGRFQPHQAGDVLSNQYGDCKDKSTLLIAMLSAAGINADAVLIGAGITFNSAVPSPASFNHAITLAHIDGKPVWLDSTAEVSAFSMLNALIRDKQALVIPATGDAHVETTPVDPPFPSVVKYQAVGTLDDKGTSHSQITMDFRGDGEADLRQAVRTVSPAQWDELMQRMSYAMAFGGKVTNAQFSRPDDTLVPFRLSYDYEREKTGDWDNLRILPQIPAAGLADIDEKDPPVTPIQLGVPHTETDHAVMTLPKGWSANLPPSVHTHTAFATLDKTYKLENGVLTTDRRVEVLQKDLPASQWQAYHKWFKDAGLDGETYIQLIPAEAAGSSLPAPPITEDNPAAAELIHQVNRAEQRKDLTEARTLLDKANALNPNQPFLWSNYGYLAMQDHHTADAIADLQKELSLHPGEAFVSRLLASYYMFDKKPDQAITVLQDGINRSPFDQTLMLYLASIFTQRDEYPLAEKTLRDSLARIPSSAALQLRLGQVLLHEQKTAEGETLLKSVISTSTDPLQLNNAAYELANNSLDLPLAETASRRSLDLLDEASGKGETGPAALARAELITSAWDTYGWILYTDNKIAEAEPWIRAAWRNSQSAETGYHLAILLEKQNHLPQALHQLQLASAGRRGDDVAVQKLIDDEIAKLRPSVPTTPKKDPEIQAGPQLSYTVTLKSDPVMELHDQLSYQVPRGDLNPSGQGSAAVEFDVTNQGTTAFRIVSGDQSLQSLSDTVQHLNLDLQLPPASHATLVRRGILSCSSRTSPTCALLLLSTGGN
jgi:tetratricopeptide (TPR) repeat protein/transglutaminase-like putative cysteine protease